MALNPLLICALALALVSLAGCAKKDPRPMRTEPWLAHPSAIVSETDANAPPLLALYALREPSRVRVEVPGPHGVIRGTVTRITGELRLDPRHLTGSKARVRADLDSLSFESADGQADPALAAAARSALELPSASDALRYATFELSALEELSPPESESASAVDAALPFTRRARAMAVGELLLHGFRATRRAALDAQFRFDSDRDLPDTVLIRTRTPLVVSLETHAIRTLPVRSDSKLHAGTGQRARDPIVTIEFYWTKSN